MAIAQETLTQNGTAVVSVHWPAAMRARVMTPIVFWASLVPWASETSDALPIWPQRKPWFGELLRDVRHHPEDQPGPQGGHDCRR